MSQEDVSLDPIPTIPGRSMASAGIALGISSGAILLVLAAERFESLERSTVAGTQFDTIFKGLLATYVAGAVLLCAGVLKARRILGIGLMTVIVSCLVSTVIPLLFPVLALSTYSRFQKHDQQEMAKRFLHLPPSPDA